MNANSFAVQLVVLLNCSQLECTEITATHEMHVHILMEVCHCAYGFMVTKPSILSSCEASIYVTSPRVQCTTQSRPSFLFRYASIVSSLMAIETAFSVACFIIAIETIAFKLIQFSAMQSKQIELLKRKREQTVHG